MSIVLKKSDKTGAIERPVTAAERTLRILDAFASRPRSLTPGELSEATGLFKSVLQRYLISFEAMSYVSKRPDGRYRLDVKALLLSSAFEVTFDERKIIDAALRRLRDKTGQSVFFYVREDDRKICLMGVDSDQSLRVSLKIGVLTPMDVTSISQVLREYASGAPARQVVDETLGRWSIGEFDTLTASISAPAFDRHGALMGAQTVSGSIGWFDVEYPETITTVAAQAKRLLDDLRYVAAPRCTKAQVVVYTASCPGRGSTTMGCRGGIGPPHGSGSALSLARRPITMRTTGSNRTSTINAIRIMATGLDAIDRRSPREMMSARRSCCSAIGPRITPNTIGARGNPVRSSR
jgi:DNA-binding IclR family transcriptional regulator